MNAEPTSASNTIDLHVFVERLFEEKGFPGVLEKDVVEQIKSDILSRVEDRIHAVIINNLSEVKLEEFNTMLDNNITDKEMQDFCANNIPDLQELIAAELIVFRQEYLA